MPIAASNAFPENDLLAALHSRLGPAAPLELRPWADFATRQVLRGYALENNAITALALRYYDLTALPAEIGQLTQLRHLDLTGNRLTGLPPSFANLTALESLYLDGNQFDALPAAILALPNLRILRLDENRLAALPEDIDLGAGRAPRSADL